MVKVGCDFLRLLTRLTQGSEVVASSRLVAFGSGDCGLTEEEEDTGIAKAVKQGTERIESAETKYRTRQDFGPG